MNEIEFLENLTQNELILSEIKCAACNSFQKLKVSNDSKEKYSRECCLKTCERRKYKASIRRCSFFEQFKLPTKTIIKVLYYWAMDINKSTILKLLNINKSSYSRIISKIITCIKCNREYNQKKLGELGKIVQIDEIMMNHKCKSHRGRFPTNRTDALTMIEFDNKITQVYAVVIENKKIQTMIPIITEKIIAGTTIYTDEHRSYSVLERNCYIHSTVCHKYNFVDPATGVNTQAVESFNNCIKTAIKQRKGIKTEARDDFLIEFCWKYNTKIDRFEKILQLTKVNNS